MRKAAVLDMVNLPIGSHNLDCRLALTLYRDDGSVVDQGTRSGKRQTMCHRFIVAPGEDVAERLAVQTVPEGPIGDYETQEPFPGFLALLADLRQRLPVQEIDGPTVVIRALGFDLVGAGEIAVQVARVTKGPTGPVVTDKQHAVLPPGADVGAFLSAVHEYADRLGYARPGIAGMALLAHAASVLHTPERIAYRVVKALPIN